MIHKSQQGMLTPQQICRRLQKPLAIKPYTPDNSWGLYLVSQHAKAVLWWSEYLQVGSTPPIAIGWSYDFARRVNQHLHLIDYDLCHDQNKELLRKVSWRNCSPFMHYLLLPALNWANLLEKRPDFAQFVNPYTSLVILFQQNFFLEFGEGRVVIIGPDEHEEVPPYELNRLGTDFDESVFDLYPYEDDNSNT